jgi:hypothetical protein
MLFHESLPCTITSIYNLQFSPNHQNDDIYSLLWKRQNPENFLSLSGSSAAVPMSRSIFSFRRRSGSLEKKNVRSVNLSLGIGHWLSLMSEVTTRFCLQVRLQLDHSSSWNCAASVPMSPFMCLHVSDLYTLCVIPFL